MSRRPIIALSLLLLAAPCVRADSISAQGSALSRSTSAVSLSPAMPSGPPALSEAGAPDVRADVSVSPAPVSDAQPAPAAPPAPVPAVAPAPTAPVRILDADSGSAKVVVGRGKRRTAVPGGALLVDRQGRRLEVARREAAPTLQVVAAPQAAPALAATASDDGARKNVSARRRNWRLFLGVVGTAAIALGFAIR